MPAKGTNVAEQLAAFLSERGVKYIFGLPGGENVAFIEALRRIGIEFILTHHETPAAYAADVTGQYTGRPGVCLSTVGPGAVNLLAGAAAATLERSPMLAITAEVDLSWQPRVTHMQVELNRLFQPVVKGSFSIRPETALHDFRQAWDLAASPPFGAVHISLAPDVAAQTAMGDQTGSQDPHRPKTLSINLKQAQELVQQSQKLFILAGVGVEMGGAQAALLGLAEAWGVPVAVTPKAKGHFPDSHPLYGGCFTAYGDQRLRRELAASDLIIGVGLDGVDFVTSTWEISTPLINLSPGGSPDPVTRPQITLTGDLPNLISEIKGCRSRDGGGENWALTIREAIAGDLETGTVHRPGTLRLMPLILALREALPPEGAITIDVGVFKLVLLQAWRTELPKTVFVANGLSAMGYAVPAALAVSLAEPQKPAVAIVGDGALQMYAGELGTVSRLGLPVMILVVVDNALSLIRLKQLRQATEIYGTEFGHSDYQALAQAYGLAYSLITDEKTTASQLKDALALKKPILVEARIDREEYNHFK